MVAASRWCATIRTKGAKGVAAVIDKDMGGELLAEDCQADYLFLLTAVEYVCTSFGTPEQKALVDVSADEAEALANAGEFGKGSMEPKVRAAIKFVRSRPGRTCIIGALDKAPETMAGLFLAPESRVKLRCESAVAQHSYSAMPGVGFSTSGIRWLQRSAYADQD